MGPSNTRHVAKMAIFAGDQETHWNELWRHTMPTLARAAYRWLILFFHRGKPSNHAAACLTKKPRWKPEVGDAWASTRPEIVGLRGSTSEALYSERARQARRN